MAYLLPPMSPGHPLSSTLCATAQSVVPNGLPWGLQARATMLRERTQYYRSSRRRDSECRKCGEDCGDSCCRDSECRKCGENCGDSCSRIDEPYDPYDDHDQCDDCGKLFKYGLVCPCCGCGNCDHTRAPTKEERCLRISEQLDQGGDEYDDWIDWKTDVRVEKVPVESPKKCARYVGDEVMVCWGREGEGDDGSAW